MWCVMRMRVHYTCMLVFGLFGAVMNGTFSSFLHLVCLPAESMHPSVLPHPDVYCTRSLGYMVINASTPYAHDDAVYITWDLRS